MTPFNEFKKQARRALAKEINTQEKFLAELKTRTYAFNQAKAAERNIDSVRDNIWGLQRADYILKRLRPTQFTPSPGPK